MTLLISPLLFPLIFSSWQTPTPSTIHWHKDLATARAASARDGRPVLAYFTFDT